jgi:hypothetical protein
MDLQEKTIRFVILVRGLMRQDDLVLPPTRKTVAKLRLMIDEILVDKEQRKPILQAITGFPLLSQKHLTQHVHSVLIQLLEANQYAECIKFIEVECKTRFETFAFFKPQNLYSSERLCSKVSDLQKSTE